MTAIAMVPMVPMVAMVPMVPMVAMVPMVPTVAMVPMVPTVAIETPPVVVAFWEWSVCLVRCEGCLCYCQPFWNSDTSPKSIPAPSSTVL
jgi:hypothetical protein